MNFPHFVRIDRDGDDDGTHFVVHVDNPKFTVELMADRDSPDKLGRGVIKRVCVPNSWAGDYGGYAKWLTKAQEFFAQSHPGHPRRPRP